MSAGILQLVATGVENLYLTSNPQVTFFKLVYRRHTNFSKEQIPVHFIETPEFGKKYTCILPTDGDLISGGCIEIILPSIPSAYSSEFDEGNNRRPFRIVPHSALFPPPY